MVLEREQAQELRRLSRSLARFSEALRHLADANPPADRFQTNHPEIARLADNVDRASAIVEAAVKRSYMTAAEYGRIAARFETIAEAMESGAGREAAAEKRAKGRARRKPKKAR